MHAIVLLSFVFCSYLSLFFRSLVQKSALWGIGTWFRSICLQKGLRFLTLFVDQLIWIWSSTRTSLWMQLKQCTVWTTLIQDDRLMISSLSMFLYRSKRPGQCYCFAIFFPSAIFSVSIIYSCWFIAHCFFVFILLCSTCCGFFMLKYLELWNDSVVPTVYQEQILAFRKILTTKWLEHERNRLLNWRSLLDDNMLWGNFLKQAIYCVLLFLKL